MSSLEFDWDDANIQHIATHGITPSEAEQVIDNEPFDLDFNTQRGEVRTKQLGETDARRVLVVVTTSRDQKVRVVTAYPADGSLRKLYATQKEVGRDEGAHSS